ncbi:hypothetical protein G6F24_018944 [Rhizopus arrhizus]|nr:hypothetical protein G6F24_018944 [Rhizopus arrhizus]
MARGSLGGRRSESHRGQQRWLRRRTSVSLKGRLDMLWITVEVRGVDKTPPEFGRLLRTLRAGPQQEAFR